MAGIGGLVALSLVVGSISRMPAASPADTADEIKLSLRTGSVLFMAPDGYRCRQSLIDNATWLIRENGFVDCDSAISQITSSQRQKWSADRVEAIRSGLSGR
jgi:hypothetical protein